MDQVKIGSFLKELRKGKGLTQEQLAEKFGVAGRTVSRWETGSNLPDLAIIVELADFYDVDIREIFDGERKSEIMNTEMKDTLLQAADYADEGKNRLLKNVRNITIVGTVCLIAALLMEDLPSSHFVDSGRGVLAGVGLGALITNILYTTGILAKVKEKKNDKALAILFIAFFIVSAIFFFRAIFG